MSNKTKGNNMLAVLKEKVEFFLNNIKYKSDWSVE